MILRFLFFVSLYLSCASYFRLGNINFDLSDFIFLIVAVGVFFKFRYLRFVKIKSLRIWIYISIFIFLIGFLISGYKSDLERYWIVFAQYCYGIFVIPFVMKDVLKDNPKLIDKGLFYFTLGILSITVFGIIIYHFFPLLSLRFSSSASRRMGSLMENPNQMASFLCIAFLMLTYLRERKEVGLFFYIFSLGIIIYGLLLTGSFSGLLTFMVSLLCYLFLIRGYRLILYVLSFITIVSVFVMLNLIPETITSRIEASSSSQSGYGSYDYRMELNDVALDIITKKPFIGIGLNNFQNYSGYPNDVHNAFLLIWAEAGILPIIGMFIMFSSLIFTIFRLFRQKRLSRPDLAFLIALCACIVIALSNHTHFYARFWFIPIVFIILILNSRYAVKRI